MNASTGLRLSRLAIKNYKKLDSLEIDFPQPLMESDLDILVFGSKNGGGKTSVIECSALLILAGVMGEKGFNRLREAEPLLDVANLLVKAGQSNAILKGDFEQNGEKCQVSLTIHRKGFMSPKIEGDESLFRRFQEDSRQWLPNGLEYAVSSISSQAKESRYLEPTSFNVLSSCSSRSLNDSYADSGSHSYFSFRHRISIKFNSGL